VGTFLSRSLWSNRSQLTHLLLLKIHITIRGEFSPSWSLEQFAILPLIPKATSSIRFSMLSGITAGNNYFLLPSDRVKHNEVWYK
jgi:hypothetical protein